MTVTGRLLVMNLKVELPESTWQQITNMLDNYLSLSEGQPDRDLENPATDLKKAIEKAKHVGVSTDMPQPAE